MGDENPARSPRSKGWRRRALRIVLLLSGGYLLWCLGLYFFQEKLIFPAHVAGPGGRVPAGWERIEIGGDGNGPSAIGLIWLPVGAGAEQPAPIAVAFHGNAELAEDFARSVEVQQLCELGFAVLVPEFRGYGPARGSPSQRGITSDSIRLIEAFGTMRGVDARRPLYVGRSLGGGVACAVAAERPPAALILQSTFTSVASFAARHGAPAFLVRHPFRNDEVVAKLDRPLLIFHGKHDEIVPVEQAQALAKAARHAEIEEVFCGHLDFPPDVGAYQRRVRKFLEDQKLLPGKN